MPVEKLKLLGLTPSEIKLALHLADGKRLKLCAAELGITYETARTKLKNVFAKTGTNRQTKLILFMLARTFEAP